jgi:hypothetical protein
MDIQMALATRVIETGSLRPLRDNGLEPSLFSNPDAQYVLEYAVIHHRETGTLPTREMVIHYLPGIELIDTQDTTESLCLHVIDELSSYAFRELSLQTEDVLNELGPIQGASELANRFRRIASRFGKTSTYVLGSRPDTEMREYTTPEVSHPNVRVCWGPFQEEAGGLGPGEIMMIYARPKKMKTWSLIEQAVFSFFDGLRVLLFSPEMPVAQIMGRVYALVGGWPYRLFRSKKIFLGHSQEAEFNRFRMAEIINLFHQNPNFIVHDADQQDSTSIHVLESLVEEYEPQILCVDQIGYLDPDGPTGRGKNQENVRLGRNTRFLKGLTGKAKIPGIFTHQQNRTKSSLGDGADDVYGSDQPLQNCDYVVKQILDHKHHVRLFDMRDARETGALLWAAMAHPCENMGILDMESPLAQASIASLQEKEEKSSQKTPRTQSGKVTERPRPLISGGSL